MNIRIVLKRSVDGCDMFLYSNVEALEKDGQLTIRQADENKELMFICDISDIKTFVKSK